MTSSSTSPVVEPIRTHLDEFGQLAYKIERVNDRFVIHYSDDLRFNIAPHLPLDHPDLVRVDCPANVSQSIQAHYYSNHVVPMIKAWRGSTVLHSSSVHVHSGCVGFFGPSGAGKSTLANMLSLRPEFSFWSDDWLEIYLEEESFITPYFPGHTRLHPDHTNALKESFFLQPEMDAEQVEDKLLFTPPSPSHEQKSILRSLYELIPSEANVPIHCERLSSAEAFRAIIANIFRLDTRSREHMKREYQQTLRIVETIPVFRFHYPHHLEEMEASLHFIGHHINDSIHHP